MNFIMTKEVSPQQHKAPAAGGSSKPLILAIDNAVMYLNMLKKLLKDAPYDLHCSETSDDALAFLAGNRVDVILLDVEMPGDMDGYALARKIKADGHKVPIIFITAHSDKEYADKAVDVGAIGVLIKPLRINQLLEKLKEAI